MWQFILGSAGFLLYFIYDINSIKKKNTFFQKFFAWGTVLVALSLVMELWISWGPVSYTHLDVYKRQNMYSLDI